MFLMMTWSFVGLKIMKSLDVAKEVNNRVAESLLELTEFCQMWKYAQWKTRKQNDITKIAVTNPCDTEAVPQSPFALNALFANHVHSLVWLN